MKITEQQLRRAVPGVSAENLPGFVKTINEWAERFGINTPLRVVHYLAQVFHESGNLRHREENLNYSADGLLKVFPKYFKSRTEALAYATSPKPLQTTSMQVVWVTAMRQAATVGVSRDVGT